MKTTTPRTCLCAALFLIITCMAVFPGFRATLFRASAAGADAKAHPAPEPSARAFPPGRDPAWRARVSESYGKMPLRFEANVGQTDPRVKFLARGSGYTLFLTRAEAVLRLRTADCGLRNEGPGELDPESANPQSAIRNPQSNVVRVKLAGAAGQPRVSGLDELPGKSHYLIGDEPGRWRTNVAGYARVKYEAVYPGIDLVWSGNQRQLEYDLVVAPGASLKPVRLAFSGAQSMRIDDQDALVLHAAGGEVRMLRPRAWQEVDGERVEVACRYRINQRHQVEFLTGRYDCRKPLVIDPVLQYSTFLGGAGTDQGFGVAVDNSGNAYLTGSTSSTDFPGPSAIQSTKSSNNFDAFVLKLNPSGSALVYATWLGGSQNDAGYAIAVDAGGNAYVAGETFSPDFPKTGGALQPSLAGFNDAFVAKLNPTGSALLYATFLGGTTADRAQSLAVDGAGNAYVAGFTDSINFPTAGSASSRSGSPVFRSSNGGGNWDASARGITASSIIAFAADTTTANTFYAASSIGLFKSTDGGSNWSLVGAPPSVGGFQPTLLSFAIDPQSPATIYLGTSGGVYKSTNGGQSFELRSTGLQIPTINALLVDPQTTTTLYAGTFNGAFKSTNGGDSWSPINTGLSIPPGTQTPRVNRFVLDPANPATVYAGTDRGMFKTTNGGGNWIAVNNGFSNLQPGTGPSIAALVIDPSTPTTLYVGVAGFSGAVYKSTDGGVSWAPANNGLAQTGDGFTFLPNVTALAITPTSPSTLYAATSSGVYKTTDGGANWSLSNDGLSNAVVNALIVDPNNAANVYAGLSIGTDAFVAKLNPAGSALVYSRYLGGSLGDIAYGIAVDAGGNAWVSGTTASQDFPTASPLQAANAGGSDLFVTKLNPAGSALTFSTYLGGSFTDEGRGIALDAAGNAYLTGYTSSTNFPTSNAVQPASGGSNDAIIVKLKADGSALLYSTYLGGTNSDQGLGIAVDAAGNAWVTGLSSSQNFPAVGALQTGLGGSSASDAFVARLNASGSKLLFSSLIGGTGTDQGSGIAVDATGNAYVTGVTSSPNFPTVSPLQPALRITDAFALKLALNADLAVVIGESRDPVMVNNQLTYTLTITNNGPDDTGGVAVTDTLPSGVTLVSSSASQGTCSGNGPVTCNLGELASGAKATVTVVVTPTTVGTITNRASVAGSTPDLNPANNSAAADTRVSAQPSIAGRVTLGASIGLGGVTMSLGGSRTAAATTAGDGFYQFADLTAGGNYTVSPARPGYVFNPPNRGFSNVTADQTANFAAVACNFTIAPMNQTFPATGGTGAVAITSPDPQCPWTARSNVPWITFTAATSSQGSGSVAFNVAPTTASRTGTLTVAGNTFTVWQEVSPSAVPDFITAKLFAAGKAPSNIVSGDFNKDGKLDIAVANDDSKITVLLGTGPGTFSDPITINSYGRITALTTGDFNGDGNLDLAATIYDQTQNVIVHLGTGTGSFGNYAIFSAGSLPGAIAVADFNGDGKADIATANQNSHNVSILLGTGTGNFGAAVNFGTFGDIPYPQYLAAGDFNGDNKADVAVVGAFGLAVLRGDGTGALGAPVRIDAGPNPAFIKTGDFNKDGRADLAIATNLNGRSNVAILLANSSGGFNAPVNVPISSEGSIADGVPNWLATGDLNGDGNIDLLAVISNSASIIPLLGNGAGAFTVGTRFTSGLMPYAAVIEDFTGDGKVDVVASTPGRQNGNGLVSLFVGQGSGGFAAAKSYTFNSLPVQTLAGDFTGDGKLDLLTLIGNCGTDACRFNGAVILRAGDGKGNFGAASSFAVGDTPLAMTSADFNGDGRPDVAVANINGNSVSVLLNNGTGGFSGAVNIPVSDKPRFISVGDFNGDGKADLVVSHLTATLNQTVSIPLGNGSGGFGTPLTLTLDQPFSSVAVGDLNGDGRADLIGSFYFSDPVSAQNGKIFVLLGNGDGSFQPPRRFASGISASSLLIYDFNGDGRPDIAAATGSNTVAILAGDGAGNLSEPVSYALQVQGQGSTFPRALALGDFNGDGKPDLAVTNGGASLVEVLTGNGAGVFSTAVGFGGGVNPLSVAVGDFNGDGRDDLALANYTGSVTVLLNNRLPNSNNAAVTVSAANYTRSLAAEGIAAVFGTSLATSTQAASSIPLPTSLGGTRVLVRDSVGVERLAPLFFVSAGQVNYLIPPGTAAGGAVVTVTSGNGTVSAGTVQVESVAPGVFTANSDGQGVAAAYVLRVKADGSQSTEPVADYNAAQAKFVSRPIDLGPETDQLFLILYGTGIRNRSSLFTVTVKAGGVDCEVLYAGAQGFFVGLDQLNVRLPRSLAGRGEVDVLVTADSKAANTVSVSIR